MLRRRLLVGVAAMALFASSAGAALASHINHYHTGSVTNISGACDVTWEHTLYTSTQAQSEVIEVSSCDNVQDIIRWFDEDIGAINIYGPQQNGSSTVNASSGILSITWQKACGNATCQQKS